MSRLQIDPEYRQASFRCLPPIFGYSLGMQPIEQTPSLHPEASADPRTIPAHGEQIDATVSTSSEGVPHLPTSLRDRFRSEILPLLSTIRNVDPTNTKSPIIRDFQLQFENSELRAVAWEHIGVYGAPHNLSLSQQQLLAATLMPYVGTDKDQSWSAFARMTALAASSEDMQTYELAGKTALGAELPEFMIELLAQPFAAYATHNAERVPALSPWMKLFIERGTEDSCAILIDTMVRRLEAAERSSYDHILSVLCRSPQPLALHAIRNCANPPLFDEKSLNPPMSLLAGLCVVDAARVIPFTVLGSYVFGGFAMMTSPITPLIALALGTAHTWIVRQPMLRESAREYVAQQEALARSPHYEHFVDKVFEKLCALPPERKDASEILDIMEIHPTFEHKRSEWRQLRSTSGYDA
jgi:hypothetical protein